eukprot:4907506-Alexandrium_andersonii.AAC.1
MQEGMHAWGQPDKQASRQRWTDKPVDIWTDGQASKQAGRQAGRQAKKEADTLFAVSYTHLTLPTICSV